MPPYQYARLPYQDCIRLVRLTLAPVTSTNPHGFCLSVFVIPLDASPDFHAISYTWGPAEFPYGIYSSDHEPSAHGWSAKPKAHPRPHKDGDANVLARYDDGERVNVLVDGSDFGVHPNLFDFLRRVANDARAERSLAGRAANGLQSSSNAGAGGRAAESFIEAQKLMWIDALSINQLDKAERSAQVARMGFIYKRATKVLVWMGGAEPDPDIMWTVDVFVPALLKASKAKEEIAKKAKATTQGGTAGPRDNDTGTLSTSTSLSSLTISTTSTTRMPTPTPSRTPEATVSYSQGLDIFALDPGPEFLQLIGPEIWRRWLTAWLPFFRFLLRQRWMTRGWVVQEVALRERRDDVIVLCGLGDQDATAGVLPWGTLLSFFPFVSNGTRSYRSFKRLLSDNLPGWSNGMSSSTRLLSFEDIEFLVRHGANDGLQESYRADLGAMTAKQRWYCRMFDITSRMRGYSFSDRRDYIYGCLGFATEMLPPGMVLPMLPDYHKSADDVFVDFAAMLLTNMPYLDELSRVEDRSLSYGRRPADLPSWVPDYTTYNTTRRICSGDVQGWRNFDASNARMDRGSCIPPVVSGRTLILRGARFATIREGKYMKAPSGEVSDFFFAFCRDRDGTGDETYAPTGQTRVAALYHSLAMYDASGPHLEDDAYAEVFRQWLLALLVKILSELSPALRDMWLERHAKDLDALARSERQAAWFPSSAEMRVAVTMENRELFAQERRKLPFRPHQYRRRHFVTERGYIGHGPKGCAPGHEIWVIEGSRAPLIFERARDEDEDEDEDVDGDEQHYRLVGEAYVHGFMRGEMLTEELNSRIAPVKLI